MLLLNQGGSLPSQVIVSLMFRFLNDFSQKTVQLLVEFDQHSHVDNDIFQVHKVEDNTLLNWFLDILLEDTILEKWGISSWFHHEFGLGIK